MNIIPYYRINPLPLHILMNTTDIDNEWDDTADEDGDIEETGAAEGPVERLRIVTDRRQEPLRIDKFLMNRIEHATRNKIQQALDAGFIIVNGLIHVLMELPQPFFGRDRVIT